MPLRPHQVEPARQLLDLLSRSDVAIDGSDMGVGKTHVAAAVAARLNLPTLCVAPKISLYAWRAAAALEGDAVSVINYELLRTGTTPYGWWDNPPPTTRAIYFQCTHCQRKYKDGETIDGCYCRPDGIHCFDTRKVAHRYGRFHFHPGVRLVVFDEVHRCSGLDSLNAEILIAAKREQRKILALSATLAMSPLQLRALGYVLGLHQLSDFELWARRKGVRRIPRGGLKWLVSEASQSKIMSDIREQIFPALGVRVTTESIPDFPACDIQAELFDLDEGGKLESLYAEMGDAIAALKAHAEFDKDAEHPLTKILRARQAIELLKVPLMCELHSDYRAKGFSVALFVNFSQTIAELRKRLRTECVVDGSEYGIKFRDKNIGYFQSNGSREIILNIQAGNESISLGDTDGNFPRVGLVMPCDSAVRFRQLVGRLPRHGGRSTSYYRVLFAANSPEVRMHRALRAKLNNLDALNDGDLSPENLLFT
jgi:hypothetical protein